ncbi:uncharacterized protein LOC143576709 [Bidens hawaiensis]|uniref:uncharacterized protein LOC143576709 n=1 Tax=Bidens hawaiensis TaxID=980011 RepID=UPI00404A70DC
MDIGYLLRNGQLMEEFLGSLSSVPDKSRASSLPPIPKTELMLVDPPSEMKRLVEKIVEFIIKNGRQFETVLMEQDRGHGRFPFLIPSNIFHPYYLKVLQRTQEVLILNCHIIYINLQTLISYEDEQESEHERSRKKHGYEDEDSEHEYSRKKHRSHHSSHDEDDSDDKHSRRKRKHGSHKSSHRHKHRKSHSSRHKEKHDVSSEEDSRDQNKADKNVKGPNSEREELEEGEITGPSKGVSFVNGATREPSVDASSSFQDPRPLTQPSTTTEVSDDLRAKIRAMLMSTM